MDLGWDPPHPPGTWRGSTTPTSPDRSTSPAKLSPRRNPTSSRLSTARTPSSSTAPEVRWGTLNFHFLSFMDWMKRFKSMKPASHCCKSGDTGIFRLVLHNFFLWYIANI